MRVFVSWSGQKSRDVAEIFREWLPSVLHSVKPFVSARDIRVGTRWQTEIAGELDNTDFGLICVTKENLAAEWLNFEAGALAKSVDSSRVVPVAVDLAPAEIPNPLAQFQAVRLVREDISDLLVSMNESCSDPIPDGTVLKALDKWWPDLENELAEVRDRDYGQSAGRQHPPRSDRELLEEVLDSVRTFGRFPEPIAPRRSLDTEQIYDLVRMQLIEDGIHDWSIPVAGQQRLLDIPSPPSRKMRDLAHRIKDEFGIEITFPNRD
jgi:hypothetical protein